MRNIHGHALSDGSEQYTYKNATTTRARTEPQPQSKGSWLCSCFRKKDMGRVDDWDPPAARAPVASSMRGGGASPRRSAPRSRPLPPGGDRDLLPPLAREDIGKKCLVLDLDETLVHSSFQAVRTDVELSHFVVPVEIEGDVHNINVIRRPGLDEFMKAVGEQYEVVIFTASLAKYANPVCDIIDTYKVIKHRLFREHCTHDDGNYVKDMTLLGRDIAGVIILDNSPISYMYQPENAIPVSNFIDDPSDTDLYELVPLLEALVNVKDVTRALEKVV